MQMNPQLRAVGGSFHLPVMALFTELGLLCRVGGSIQYSVDGRCYGKRHTELQNCPACDKDLRRLCAGPGRDKGACDQGGWVIHRQMPASSHSSLDVLETLLHCNWLIAWNRSRSVKHCIETKAFKAPVARSSVSSGQLQICIACVTPAVPLLPVHDVRNSSAPCPFHQNLS